MNNRGLLIMVLVGCFLLPLRAEEDYELSHIIEGIYLSVVEESGEEEVTTPLEQLQEELEEIARNKINLNQAMPDDLRRLYFLSEEKIEKVLIYRDQQPFHNIYELQLVPGLTEWECRYLAAFSTIGETEKQRIYAKEIFRYARHEADIRLDTRNLENYTGDPVYTSIKYKFSSMQKLDFGLIAERDPGEPWSRSKTYGFDHYGGYLQLHDIGCFKTIVAGDYKANFGLGLVVSGQMKLGKTSYLSNLSFGNQGLRKYSGTNEYDFFRGAAVYMHFGDFDWSVWYSYKGIDGNLQNGCFPSIVQTGYHRTDTEKSHKKTVGQHVVGTNLSYTYKTLRVGLTAIENILSDTLRPKPNYYNEHYFTGKRQATIGAFAQYSRGRMMLFGEAAASQNKKWGAGMIVGAKITPIEDVSLMTIGRYYSPWFDNQFSSAFGETSRNNDELGLYIGAELTRVRNWRFALYGDMYKFSGPKYGIRDTTGGFEIQGESTWTPRKNISLFGRVKYKRKAGNDKATGRLQLNWQSGGWNLTTLLEGNLYKTDQISLGGMIQQRMEYRFERVPIVLQTMVEWFDARNWNNRMYAYENDVLYGFSIPASYGQGGRWYVNARWKINEHYALYLKTAETVYTKKWMTEKNLANQTKTDIHLMLRITY